MAILKLDRFQSGLPDPQNAAVLCNCSLCGGEIYANERVYVINEQIVHKDEVEEMTVEEAMELICGF